MNNNSGGGGGASASGNIGNVGSPNPKSDSKLMSSFANRQRGSAPEGNNGPQPSINGEMNSIDSAARSRYDDNVAVMGGARRRTT